MRRVSSSNTARRPRRYSDDLLEKYAEHGTAQFVIPDVLKVPPISEHGNVIEIAKLFGGPEKLKGGG